jgi:hypothetical protein
LSFFPESGRMSREDGCARMAELVDAGDLKSPGFMAVPVRFRLRAPSKIRKLENIFHSNYEFISPLDSKFDSNPDEIPLSEYSFHRLRCLSLDRRNNVRISVESD